MWALVFPSALIALLMAAPLAYLLYYGLRVDLSLWSQLWRAQLPGLLLNTLVLTAIVTAAAVALGLLLAWLVECTDLPAYRVLRPLMVSPLIIPCYIVAIVYVGFFGKRGLLERALEALGLPASVPSLYGLLGAALVLVLATFPYVYAIAGTALRRMDASLEEAARSLGQDRWQVFRRVTLPLLAPALSAGAALAALYALADFGVVSAFRYQTFVTSIYTFFGSYNRSAAAALSFFLIALTVLVLFAQARLWREQRFAPEKLSNRAPPRLSLGGWRWPAFLVSLLVFTASLLLPVGVLIYWLIESLAAPTAAQWGTSWRALADYSLNSFWTSAAAATLAIGLALIPAYWTGRHPGARLGRGIAWLSQAGVALPGVLIALGLAFFLLQWAPALYFSSMALVLAYLVRFYPQGFQALQAGLAQIPAHLEEGAWLLGCHALGAFWRVVRPLLQPALWTGWTLIFLNAARELPATLLLRPAGFDTLTVRVWTAASEGFYGVAAPAALLLVLLSLPLLFFIWREQSPGTP
jgi:iron(III) transport system permease protein